MFGKHGNGAVHEIDARGALHGFLIDDGTFLHVVAHIGYVHAYFVEVLGVGCWVLADTQGIVEVLGILGVDGESAYVAEVLAAGNFFGRDAGI